MEQKKETEREREREREREKRYGWMVERITFQTLAFRNSEREGGEGRGKVGQRTDSVEVTLYPLLSSHRRKT
jgi:hypothetical protein